MVDPGFILHGNLCQVTCQSKRLVVIAFLGFLHNWQKLVLPSKVL